MKNYYSKENIKYKTGGGNTFKNLNIRGGLKFNI